MFFLPFLMFIFLLALGEDYNILVMTRIREEAHKRPLREAVARALSATGTTVTSAGLVLAGTFIVLGLVAGSGVRRQPVPRHRARPGARHPDGHVPGPDPARAVHGGAARPVELVAVGDEPGAEPAGIADGAEPGLAEAAAACSGPIDGAIRRITCHRDGMGRGSAS